MTLLEYYLQKLDYGNKPYFLNKYLYAPSLLRLKEVGYFCGMDYASKNIYDFKEKITRFDHSLTVALLTWKYTHDKTATIAGLFHDIATPCFSHVIDYMNGDFIKQESTESYTAKIINKDQFLINCLNSDSIYINNIINFKQYPIVDNERPKLCADRLDGIILTGISWTKNVDYNDIDEIIDNIELYRDEDNKEELGFKTSASANLSLKINESIDHYCHTKEDYYMMILLSELTKYAIEKNYIKYDDLYTHNEKEILNYLKSLNDNFIKENLIKFETISKEEIPDLEQPKIKKRIINPLVNGQRLK